ncbi:MAG: PadR family transcriptional regulator [Thermoflexales bacterium]|nr:PadR family transcriptional regulator [Thermoflexales bacterium]
MSVRYALLGLLAQQPRHGYELRAAFEALVGGRDTWEVKPGQVYATLERLEEAGLIAEVGVEKEGGPEKRIYALTPAGREALQEWFHTGVVGDHHRDEFFVKLMVGLLVEGTDLHRLIQVQRNTLYQELHRFTRQRMEADSQTELAYVLFLDKVVMHLEADLRWLDMVEARLEEIQRQPTPQPEPKPRGRPRAKREA